MRRHEHKGFLRFMLFPLPFLFLSAYPGSCTEGAEIRIAWDANSEADLAGYRIYYRTASGHYLEVITIGLETTYTLTGLVPGERYCIAVTAFDLAGNESGFSNEVCAVTSDSLLGKWEVVISGHDEGAAMLWFEEHTKVVRGYGLSGGRALFGIQGEYDFQSEENVEGMLFFYDLTNEETPPEDTFTFRGRRTDGGKRISLEV